MMQRQVLVLDTLRSSGRRGACHADVAHRRDRRQESTHGASRDYR
jgi:hypothetical protein